MTDLFGKAAAVLLVAVAAIIGVAYYNLTEANQHISATRTFSSPTVAPGGELRVTIQTTGLSRLGKVEETLPEDFDYLGSDLPASRVTVSGQTVSFFPSGKDRFTYRVTASRTPRVYTFSPCTVYDIDIIDGEIHELSLCGESEVTVDATDPTPTATPDGTATTVPTPDATPVATPTKVPTPVPTATHTPIPQPSSGIGITVSSGGAHYCALHMTTGSILCWGANEHGQASPPETGSYTDIVSGETHSCALRSDGAVVCWGSITVRP